jgi:hypothetical protein
LEFTRLIFWVDISCFDFAIFSLLCTTAILRATRYQNILFDCHRADSEEGIVDMFTNEIDPARGTSDMSGRMAKERGIVLCKLCIAMTFKSSKSEEMTGSVNGQDIRLSSCNSLDGVCVMDGGKDGNRLFSGHSV